MVMSQTPLALILSCSLIALLAFSIVTFAIDSASSSVTALCGFPGMACLPFCSSEVAALEYAVPRIDYPALMDVQTHLLDDLLGRSANGIELALNVKHAELAVRDLAGVVRASNLTVKDALATSLGRFVSDAQATGRELQRLSAKARATIDSIAVFNSHALQAIRLGRERGSYHADLALSRTFQMSMDALASQVTRILLTATKAAGCLDGLEESLALIHELCAREALLQHVAVDELLWSLWTLLGGNRGKLRELKYRAEVLMEVRRYRSMAVAYVAATSQALQVADAELSELRDRLSDGSNSGADIPIEVHLASVERIVGRLMAERPLANESELAANKDIV
ncbi:hypothetical protein BN946_scf185010.g6 [Trametes cinnabarina]|uniref:Uncharacterized protein n=1 Tax=Pycnoporus cinnabarinus TaxID=5643 RepID=A0A060SLL3_PYCCI|nr:hypothetical protein BN946_scf185010.g6 [Trametes cinnabarina]